MREQPRVARQLVSESERGIVVIELGQLIERLQLEFSVEFEQFHVIEQQLEFEFQFGLEFQLRFGLEFEFVVEQLDEGRTRRRCTGSGAVGLRVASAAIRP